jgi:hypothetical protein
MTSCTLVPLRPRGFLVAVLGWGAACGPAAPEREAWSVDAGPEHPSRSYAGRAGGGHAEDRLARGQGPFVVRPGHLLLDSAAVDLTGDGELERIELHVEAERWRDGSVLWEDGHHWLLVVRRADDEGVGFVLIDRLVPHGTVRFLVLETDEASAAVVVEVLTGTGVEVSAYTFDPSQDAFVLDGSVVVQGRLVHRTPVDAFE